jgi:molybdopterin-guanine dinucleotide biosynthesis protein B
MAVSRLYRNLPAARVPLLGFAAYSGTGKTTLLRQLIPLLKAEGLRVGLIKRAHHEADIDQPGKDSHELRMAGASPVMLSTSRRRAIVMEHESPRDPVLDEELRHLDQSGLDLLLVEGFKHETFPKIELHRPALGRPLLYPNDANVIAIAADGVLDPPPPIPRLDLNQPRELLDFILTRFLPDARSALVPR